MSIANRWLLAAFAAAMSLNGLLGYLLYLTVLQPGPHLVNGKRVGVSSDCQGTSSTFRLHSNE